MAKELIQKVKGTRDFYPEQMAFRKWLYSRIQEISERYGYQEYDGPELERIELYAEKTSEEIVKEEAFTLTDRDGRVLALRPELTPTFVRMVAQKADELAFPLRWYSFGRAWRYEQPQKGRGREFFQWEVNILGPETPEADAEILAMAADYLRTVGLTPDEVVIRVNDRSYLEQVLAGLGLEKERFLPVLRVIDRKEKMSTQEFEQALLAKNLTAGQVEALNDFLQASDYRASPWLSSVFDALKSYPGATDYVRFDPIIVRGFDYYTRTVFEAWDKTGGLKRALFGGGRFDNLTSTLGGKRIPGVGMAPGDMPTEALLRQLNKLPDIEPPAAPVLVTLMNPQLMEESRNLAGELRAKGIQAELWVESGASLGKQITFAAGKGSKFVAIIGAAEAVAGTVTLKQLSSGEQYTVDRATASDFLREKLS